LPDTYYEASTPGTILLAGILSKAGIYGILRVGVGLFPEFIQAWSPWLLGLAIAGVFYGGLAAWRQRDFKRLLAYSSLSHVNFILVGLFVWNQTAHEGAILQAVNHGLTITALFLVAGWLEERLGSTEIDQASGLAKFFPQLCWLTVFFVMASVALPGTNNFVGELLIFVGLFAHDHWAAAILVLTVILSVLYMLRWLQKMYFGPSMVLQRGWGDIGWGDAVLALPLVALILWIGTYPAPLLKQIEPAVRNVAANATLEEPQ
jgi:NADH-quinone oxidoreductase subunit M